MNKRRASDKQDIVVRPDGSRWDRNAFAALMDDWRSRVEKPVYLARLSLDDPEIKAFEAASRGVA